MRGEDNREGGQDHVKTEKKKGHEIVQGDHRKRERRGGHFVIRGGRAKTQKTGGVVYRDERKEWGKEGGQARG